MAGAVASDVTYGGRTYTFESKIMQETDILQYQTICTQAKAITIMCYFQKKVKDCLDETLRHIYFDVS